MFLEKLLRQTFSKNIPGRMVFQSKVKVLDYWKLRWCNLSSKCLCNLGYKESNIGSMGVSARDFHTEGR